MKKLILAIVILVAFGTGSIAGKAGKKHEIMNKYGQSVGSVQRDIYGNQQFQNKYGQSEGWIKPDGTIMNKYGQSQGKIKK